MPIRSFIGDNTRDCQRYYFKRAACNLIGLINHIKGFPIGWEPTLVKYKYYTLLVVSKE